MRLPRQRRLAEVDLGDHFEFIYARHDESVGGEDQPYTEGFAVIFDVLVGANRRGTLKVDLAIGAGLTAQVSRLQSASALTIPRLVSHAYRLYPVVAQIADKVCATIQTYNGRPSSREKDLVDLVVLAVTQDVDGTALGLAISTESRRRQLHPFDDFAIPVSWGTRYANLAKFVPHCAGFETVGTARELMTLFITPALSGAARGKAWRYAARAWE